MSRLEIGGKEAGRTRNIGEEGEMGRGCYCQWDTSLASSIRRILKVVFHMISLYLKPHSVIVQL